MASSHHSEEMLYRGYVYFWSLHRWYETTGGTNQTMGWEFGEKVAVVGMAVLASLTKSTVDLGFAMAVILCMDFHKMPFIWDSEYWCMMTDVAFLWIALRQLKFREFAAVARGQMILCYAAAAFWKLNRDFFDVRASCAPIFALQMIDFFVPVMPPVAVSRLVALTSPAAIVLLEGAIALLLWLKPKIGVKLALVLHILIALAPPPNNVATFSLMCASRLILFVPNGFADVLDKFPFSLTFTAIWTFVIAVCADIAKHETFYDLGLPLFMAIVPLVWTAATLQEEETKVSWRHPLVLLAVFYNFGLLTLGLLDQGAPHMYANLRLHGGSNHFLAPTGLLQQWYFENPNSTFYGGIVRIEMSTSKYFNEIYPSDYTMQLSNGTRQLLLDAGHTSRMFNPMLTALTSSQAPWLEEEDPFVKYTLPAHEFRRMLTNALEVDDDFLLEYTQLKESLGNETWRATASGRTVRVVVQKKKKKLFSCEIRKPKRGSCLATDLPMLPPLSYWATKILFFEPYPILPGDHRLHCFGP